MNARVAAHMSASATIGAVVQMFFGSPEWVLMLTITAVFFGMTAIVEAKVLA